MHRVAMFALIGSLLGPTACKPSESQRGTTAPTPASAEAPPADAAPAPMGLTGVLDEASFKALHELTSDAAPEPRGVEVDLAGGKAYLSLPENATPPLPGVVVIQEWWGLNDNIRHWADRLAADGYAALAVDLYDGKVATTPDEAMALMKAVNEVRSREILSAAHRFLKDDPRVAAERRGVIGWCFGGAMSLEHAIAEPDVDAAVIYYGRLVTDTVRLSKIQAKLLGVFGNRDTGIPPDAVDAFVEALEKSGKTIEVHRYDADHAFANPSSARYDQTSAADAWEHVRRFLAGTLAS
jgi:carboxymethylenebutenolidase